MVTNLHNTFSRGPGGGARELQVTGGAGELQVTGEPASHPQVTGGPASHLYSLKIFSS